MSCWLGIPHLLTAAYQAVVAQHAPTTRQALRGPRAEQQEVAA